MGEVVEYVYADAAEVRLTDDHAVPDEPPELAAETRVVLLPPSAEFAWFATGQVRTP
jgi:hypothetical protein